MRPPDEPPSPSDVMKLIGTAAALSKIIEAVAHAPTSKDRYFHWADLRRRTPPAGLTREEWWAGMKLARQAASRMLPFRDTASRPFRIALPDVLLRQLSEIDRSLSGRAQVSDELTNPGTRDRYIMSALIEEAIASSQLEGAATTREVASDMLRSGRPPRDKSERMIVNNFNAMRFIRTKVKEPLTPALVLSIHREVTDRTLDPQFAGQFRKSNDVKVVSQRTGEVVHSPPDFKELPGRMKAMCDFANAGDDEPWFHPILRAVLLHFWLAYDHPFVDGNGRTARALFYWSMLKSDYRLCEFISISQIVRKAPSEYAKAYVYTESDENDATYFALYHLGVLKRAVDQLHAYVAQKVSVAQDTHKALKLCGEFNDRQIALLGHALRNPDHAYSAASHARSHMVTRPTARKDLAELAKRGFLIEVQTRKALIYYVKPELEAIVEKFGRKKGLRS
ncbi:MAG: Fic family protein [Planctomycetes bacterium]|nr:Fic family protein [Planctomycetota bacterium]